MAEQTLKAYLESLTEDTAPDAAADFVFTKDTSASSLKKAKPDNFKTLESLMFSLSDETTALTTGTAKLTIRLPYAFTVTAVRANVNTAPTGANIIVDVKEAGVSIFSTLLSIDAAEKTSVTAATPAVISDAGLADDAEMTFDITQVGSTIAGAGLKITFIGRRS